MSIKKLFDTGDSKNYSDYANKKEKFEFVESSENAKQIRIKKASFQPHIDYAKPENFIKYSSAYLFYKGALDKITDYYPYDGSSAEKNKFYNQLAEGEKYIFDNLYPTSTGYALLSADGWGTQASTVDGYGLPVTADLEYITFKGGPLPTPHSSSTTLVSQGPNPSLDNIHYASVYDENIYRTAGLPDNYGKGTRLSNLRSNFDDGVTVEFWFKKAAFDASKTQREVILDVWNNQTASGDDYGRITLELDSTVASSRAYATSTHVDMSGFTIGDTFSIKVPAIAGDGTSTGGTGTAILIRTEGVDATGAASTASTVIAIGCSTGPSAGTLAETIVDAINGYYGSGNGAYGHNFAAANSGVNTGVPGVTATLRGSTGITLTANTIGTVGNSYLVADVTGNPASGGGYFSGGTTNTPFKITVQSGSLPSGIFRAEIGDDTITKASLTSWTHFAFTFYNTGSEFYSKIYKNGVLNDYNKYSSTTISELNSKGMMGRIGSLLTAPSGSGASIAAGKLSASIDEFRFWKEQRNSQQINRNWFDNVHGGANTDISNTTLGLYYKFNEGIVGSASIDDVVLDYAGRISNGAWTGYDAHSRNTGSAIVDANAAIVEKEDPIIRISNVRYRNLSASLLTTGSVYDLNNNTQFLNYMPTWVIEDAEKAGNNNLKMMCHIAGTYFDKLYLLAREIPRVRHGSYMTSSVSPPPFSRHLPQSLGLYMPETFIDATIVEKLLNRTETGLFEGDLEDTKNQIYVNLYNNLTNIFKSKGTERAVKNVLRCFHLDDSLIQFKQYSTDTVYEIEDNVVQRNIEKNYLNLDTKNLAGVVYQAYDASNSESRGYITGSVDTADEAFEDVQGISVEGTVLFPNYIDNDPSLNAARDFVTASLFGMHMPAVAGPPTGTATLLGTDTTYATDDYCNFQVQVCRDKTKSKNAFFQLTSSNAPHPLPTLTSSIYFDVYGDNTWNFSVRVKPTVYPLASLVSGANYYTFDVLFSGINTMLGKVQNSFVVSGTMSKTVGQNFLRANKRLFVGSHRTNITGAVVHKSDVKVANIKYWTKYIGYDNLLVHANSPFNLGISGSYKAAINPLWMSSSQLDWMGNNTLALDWSFGSVTTSDSGGNFVVDDFSSGSSTLRNYYGWLGKMVGYQHTGYASGFKASSTDVVDARQINVFEFIDPEQAAASEMVNILTDDDQVFEPSQTKPNFLFTLEKSLYANVSAEMLNFFAGAIDFNNIIGHPVNRYRERYKDLEKLREAFFRRVNKITEVEKFVNYYKWFDDAISIIVGQLLPASADYVEDVMNVVEGHVLERNKYQTKFPTLEFKTPEIDGFVRGINELTYDWKHGHAPIGNTWETTGSSTAATGIGLTRPSRATGSILYWKERAERTDYPVTAAAWIVAPGGSLATVNTQRDTIRKTVITEPFLTTSMKVLKSSPTPPDPPSHGMPPAGARYLQRVEYQRRKFQRLYKQSITNVKTIQGGVNFPPSKNIHFFYNAIAPHGPISSKDVYGGSIYAPQNVLMSVLHDDMILTASTDPGPGDFDKQGIEIVRQNDDGTTTVLGALDTSGSHRKLKRHTAVRFGREWDHVDYNTAGVVDSDGPHGDLAFRSDMAFPFNIMESTIKSGYQRKINKTLSGSLTITNLHNDVYGRRMEKPMQGPFTEFAVGGHQSRHLAINRASPPRLAKGRIKVVGVPTAHDTLTISDGYTTKVFVFSSTPTASQDIERYTGAGVATLNQATNIATTINNQEYYFLTASTAGAVVVLNNTKYGAHGTTPLTSALASPGTALITWGMFSGSGVPIASEWLTDPLEGGVATDVERKSRQRGLDDYYNRPEAWKILLGACQQPPLYDNNQTSSWDNMGIIGVVGADYPWPEANDENETPYPMTASQKAVYFRDYVAKRPVNIRNIHHTSSSPTRLGNYNHNYDIVHSFGAYSNPRGFINNPAILPAQLQARSTYHATSTHVDMSGFTIGDTFSIVVPVAAGGHGTTLLIRTEAVDATGAASTTPLVIGVGCSTTPSAGTVAETIVDAINGHFGSGGLYNHSFASANSGNHPIGIPGVTATLNGSTGIKLTAVVAGAPGNTILVADVTGNPSGGGGSFTGGSPRVGMTMSSSTNVRTIYNIHRTAQTHSAFVDEYSTDYFTSSTNKSIIRTRFRAYPGIENSSLGYLDIRAGEYSVYNALNYRNLNLLKPLNPPTGTISETWKAYGYHSGPAAAERTTGSTAAIRVIDIHGKSFGLRPHLARHSAQFGRDSLWITGSGPHVTYAGIKAKGGQLSIAAPLSSSVEGGFGFEFRAPIEAGGDSTYIFVTASFVDATGADASSRSTASSDNDASTTIGIGLGGASGETPGQPAWTAAVTEAFDCIVDGRRHDRVTYPGGIGHGGLRGVHAWKTTGQVVDLESDRVGVVGNKIKIRNLSGHPVRVGSDPSPFAGGADAEAPRWLRGAPGATYTQLPSFHKNYRNRRRVIKLFENIYPKYEVLPLINTASLTYPITGSNNGNGGTLYMTGSFAVMKKGHALVAAVTSSGITWSGWLYHDNDNRVRRIFQAGITVTNTVPLFAIEKSLVDTKYRLTVTIGTCDGAGSYDGGEWYITTSTPNAWQHVAVAWTGSEGSLASDPKPAPNIWINGVSQTVYLGNTPLNEYPHAFKAEASFKNSADIHTNGYDFVTFGGNHSTKALSFSGSLDEVSIWKRPLIQSEIDQLYNYGYPCDVTGSTMYVTASSDLWEWIRMGDGDAGPNAVNQDNPQALSDTNQITGEINAITFLPYAEQGPTKASQMKINDINGAGTPDPPLLNTGCPGVIDEPALEVYNSAYTASKYDNFYIGHSIPKTTLQYSWITSSYFKLNDPVLGGYVDSSFRIIAQPSGKLHNSIDFTSASDMGATGKTGILTTRVFGQDKAWQVSAVYKTFVPVDFARLNTVILDTVSTSSLTVGNAASTKVGTYLNMDVIDGGATTMGSASILNALLLNRNGPYGYTSFTRLREAQTSKILRALKQKNMQHFISATGSSNSIATFETPPVTLRGRPLSINCDELSYEHLSEDGVVYNLGTQNISLRCNFSNEYQYYSLDAHDDQFNIDLSGKTTVGEQLLDHIATNTSFALNWVVYEENIFPSRRNEFMSHSVNKKDYDNLYWRENIGSRLTLGGTLKNSQDITVSQSSWILDGPNDFMTRSGSAKVDYYWHSYPDDGITGSYQLITSAMTLRTSNSAGELQNTYSSYFTSSNWTSTKGGTTHLSGTMNGTIRGGILTPAALYARKHMITTPHSVVSPSGMDIPGTGSGRPGLFETTRATGRFHDKYKCQYSSSGGVVRPDMFSGEALWEAPTQAGIVEGTTFVSYPSSPWFNDYDSYNYLLNKVSSTKGFAIVPEYRISEHVSDYINNGVYDENKFDTFEIPHTTLSSSQDSFYRDYSNSEFLHDFLNIQQLSGLPAREIRLVCSASIRYNPYKGFYPAQRTVDLVEQFRKSYSGDYGDWGDQGYTLAREEDVPGESGSLLKGLYQALFAPGILYNTIKSGMAVDYPIVQNFGKIAKDEFMTNSGSNNWAITTVTASSLASGPHSAGSITTPTVAPGAPFFDHRLSFASIIYPETLLNGHTFVDMDSHPSASVWNSVTPTKIASALATQQYDEKVMYTFDRIGDGVYSLMARNFFGAVAPFFLEDSTNTRLVSDTTEAELHFNVGPVYMSRVTLRRSGEGTRVYSFESGSYNAHMGTSTMINKAYCAIGGALVTQTGSSVANSTLPGFMYDTTGEGYPIPQDPVNTHLSTRGPWRETFTLYSRPTAFGPPLAGVSWESAQSASIYYNNNVMDSFTGYNGAYTPPYYNGEAWADIIFRPSRTTAYTLKQVLTEATIVYWRVDAGFPSGSSGGWDSDLGNQPYQGAPPSGNIGTTLVYDDVDLRADFAINSRGPSGIHGSRGNPRAPYAGSVINANSMQLSASINLRQVEPVYHTETDESSGTTTTSTTIDGYQWIIQPHFETPHMNFASSSVNRKRQDIFPMPAFSTGSLPIFGESTQPRGMWHQFGTLDGDDKGIFLEVGDIPSAWLKNHHMCKWFKSPYNDGNLKKGQTLYTDVRPFTEIANFATPTARLGKLKEKLTVYEAIVAIPYIVTYSAKSTTPMLGITAMEEQKEFISIPEERYEAAIDDYIGTKYGDSEESAGGSIRRQIELMKKYILPPELDFYNTDDDTIEPFVMYFFEFEYSFDKDDLSYIWQNLAPRNSQKITTQATSTSHELIDTELLTEENLEENEKLRWMVFKVKQRDQSDWNDLGILHMTAPSMPTAFVPTEDTGFISKFNWPYDYLSFVEKIQMNVEVLFGEEESALEEVTDVGPAAVSTAASSEITSLLGSLAVPDTSLSVSSGWTASTGGAPASSPGSADTSAPGSTSSSGEEGELDDEEILDPTDGGPGY